MKDWPEIHRRKIEEERRAILIEGASIEHFVAGARARQFPPGSIYLWSIGVVGPVGSEDVESNAA